MYECNASVRAQRARATPAPLSQTSAQYAVGQIGCGRIGSDMSSGTASARRGESDCRKDSRRFSKRIIEPNCWTSHPAQRAAGAADTRAARAPLGGLAVGDNVLVVGQGIV